MANKMSIARLHGIVFVTSLRWNSTPSDSTSSGLEFRATSTQDVNMLVNPHSAVRLELPLTLHAELLAGGVE